ncbi:MAG: hypothetical protein FWJ93_04090 [Micromonosporaceae bacterium]
MAAAALPFAVDAATFAVAAVLVLTLPRVRPAVAVGPGIRSGLFGDAVSGVRWLLRLPTLRLLAALGAAANLVIGALMAVLVLIVLDIFGVPEVGYGLVLMVGSAGPLVGALVAGRLGARVGTLRTLRWVLVAQAAALVVLAAARHVVPGTAALAVFVAGSAVWNVLANSYLQWAVPTDLLGRVGSANRIAAVAAAPVGAGLGGLLADWLGVPAMVACAAVLFAVLALFGWRALGRHSH